MPLMIHVWCMVTENCVWQESLKCCKVSKSDVRDKMSKSCIRHYFLCDRASDMQYKSGYVKDYLFTVKVALTFQVINQSDFPCLFSGWDLVEISIENYTSASFWQRVTPTAPFNIWDKRCFFWVKLIGGRSFLADRSGLNVRTYICLPKSYRWWHSWLPGHLR